MVWQGGSVGALAAWGGALFLLGGERAPMRLPLHRRDAPAAPLPHLARLVAAAPVHRVRRSSYLIRLMLWRAWRRLLFFNIGN